MREGRPLEDTEFIERARRGDLGAYDVLVERYQEMAFRLAYVVTGDADEAEDAAQEAFVKAYAALARFRSGAPFRPWILRIVGNEARNRRKAVGRRANLVLRVQMDPSSDDAVPSPEKAVVDAEQRDVLLGAVNELREEERLTITYRYFFGLSEAELAAAFGCARGTVKSRLSRALGRLRDILSRSDGGEAVGIEPRRGAADG